tara:strand:- start:486 stop:983 length:498 start_codon:yes stop_codon:yes gene_type:complete
MKKLILLLLFIPLVFSCEQRMTINKYSGYSNMNYDEKGVVFAVEKIDNGIITSTFIIKENDDWSFTILTNKEYIENQINSKEYEKALKSFYPDSNIITKTDFYFKSVGNVLLIVYSYKEGEIDLVNTIFQFIKNNKLYTATGSSVRNSYRESFDDYKSMIGSIKF